MRRKYLYLISRVLFFLPDTWMLRLQYLIKKGKLLNLRNPQRFSEKIQLYKAYYRDERMLICTDKYAVRNYVKEKLGTEKYLNELYQVCENANEIDFSKLPDKFVIKTTDGGNGLNIIICKDKNQIDITSVVNKINSWKRIKYYLLSREWAYKWATDGKRSSKIIIEKYLENKENSDASLDDFKFYCYNGEFKYLAWDKNRYNGHRRRFYDANLNYLEKVWSFPDFNSDTKLPSNIQEMISISEILSNDFPFARVDLYNVDGLITFGEITFYPSSGYMNFSTDSFDFEMGKYFNVDFAK